MKSENESRAEVASSPKPAPPDESETLLKDVSELLSESMSYGGYWIGRGKLGERVRAYLAEQEGKL